MDDRLREFGEVPGYEFDAPRASGRPSPVVGGGGPPRQTWPRGRPAGDPSWPGGSQPGGAVADHAAGDAARVGGRRSPAGRLRAGLARNTLAAMRARNLLTSLAVPLVAAIAIGVAGVVVLGANNRGGTAAPSALAAGFPPARSAAADFGGGGRPVQVAAIAADGATEVAVGSANRGCALWVSADGGSTWHRGALTPPRGQARAPGSSPGWRTARPAGSRSAAPRP